MNNLEITFNLRDVSVPHFLVLHLFNRVFNVQEEQAGVAPKCRNFYPRSQSNDRDRYYRNYVRSNGHSTRGNSINGRQESQCSEESESGKLETGKSKFGW